MDQFHGNSAQKGWEVTNCLDPQDLDRAIQREHYPLPTTDEIATRLHGAKVFAVLDVCQGFCSSFLRSTHPLADIDGSRCHLGSALPQKSFNATCMK